MLLTSFKENIKTITLRNTVKNFGLGILLIQGITAYENIFCAHVFYLAGTEYLVFHN